MSKTSTLLVFNSDIQIINHSPKGLAGTFLSLAALPGIDLDPVDENGLSEIGKSSLGYQCFLQAEELGY